MSQRSFRVVWAIPILIAAMACAASQSLQAHLQPSPPSTQTPTSPCPSAYQVGYLVARFNNVNAAVWYPSATTETTFNYSSQITSSLAKDGEPLRGCGTFPLVIFSHGLLGCGDQSIFFTETLARHGYVVVAPDYKDALLCSVDGTASTFSSSTQEPPILDPSTWNDTSFVDRKEYTENVLDGVLQDQQLNPIINVNAIGIAGHSLGGYTALAMVGGWPSWKDDRFKAALLMSPYTLPFSINNTLKGVIVPLMYQGAELDVGITPFLEGNQGAYAQSNPPKYFVKLRGGSHFTWTNAVCAKEPVVADCVQSKPEAGLIDAYGIAFFDEYLKGLSQPLLTSPNLDLSKYLDQP